jgi:hypothetical protein
MPATLPQFDIDDAESVDQNLQRFGELLKQLDPQLGEMLALKLRDLADRDPTDLPALWDALFNRLVPPLSEEVEAEGEVGANEAAA